MTDLDYTQRIEALAALIAESQPDRRYFVDFDFTLMLANSTDTYIGSAQPRFIFWPLVKALGLLRPWVLRGENSNFLYRDATRLKFVKTLRPRLTEDFSAIADETFKRHQNTALIDLLAQVDPSQIVIVSFGLTDVLKNLLLETRYSSSLIVASTHENMTRDRGRGKLGMLRDNDLLPDPSRDAVITDSARDDLDLLNYVDHAFHIEWQ